MVINWSAYEAAKELYGNNKENIQDIGSRFPLFARTVSLMNSDYLLDILKALPKVTARVVETGLKDMEIDECIDMEEEAEETPKTEGSKKMEKKSKQKESNEDENDYESMTSKELYNLCCERGISSKCKSRSKNALIDILVAYDNGEIESTKGKVKKKDTDKVEKARKADPEPEEDDWDTEEEEGDSDPYAGKSAKELYKMCTDRGIKTKTKQSADVYAKLLKKADEAEQEDSEEEDDDEDWEI